MSRPLHQRLARLESKAKAQRIGSAVILCGTQEETEQQERDAIATGRMKTGDPVLRIVLCAPAERMAA
ncbi:hypothetical protein [Bosea sp. 124]|uniref:hypothetical protein n=1 Tax=Bosea sp. 124 TaxID=2135642 RepID=UPI000D35B81C|nr:hypothetical protein [Bosea sp. 124]PTM40937.1 hypothetical protein C8D03_2470 [Bosea sp. 124]